MVWRRALLSAVLAVAALTGLGAPYRASAQAYVVPSCGTAAPPYTPLAPAGVYTVTMSPLGQQCVVTNVATSSATATAQTSLVVTGASYFMGATAVNSAAGFIMIWDATSAPPDGVVSPAYCYPVPSPSSGGSAASMANTPAPVRITNGIVVVFSTGADCFHKTASSSYLVAIYQ